MSSTIDGVDRLIARRALELFRSTLAWLEQDIAAIPLFDPIAESAVDEMHIQARRLRQLASFVQDALNEPTVATPAVEIAPDETGEIGDDDAPGE